MKIAFLGDIALLGRASIEGNPLYMDYFHDVASLLQSYDYVVGNLESPFSYQKKKYGAKSAFLSSDPQNVDLLNYLHVNAVTLANNHMFDYGRESFELTQHLLDKNEIAWFGLNGKELLLEFSGNKIAFTGFCCYSSNPQGCVEYGKYGVNELDVRKAEEVLTRLHEKGYMNVCAIHAGIEHVNYPSLDTIELAKRIVSIGTTIYYGHHPHVVQPVERMGNSLVAYSLGNFCFDDTYSKSTDDKPHVELTENNRSSFILSVTIDCNTIREYEIIPLYIGTKKMEIGRGVTKRLLDSYLDKMKTMTSDKYEEMRHEQRMEWVKPRLAKRDIAWVIKRLRPMYLKLMISNNANAKNYKKHVSDQL